MIYMPIRAAIFCGSSNNAWRAGIRAQADKHFGDKNLMEICTSRARKTHWQYLASMKNDYLIPGNKVRR
jgi:hypothetical protein